MIDNKDDKKNMLREYEAKRLFICCHDKILKKERKA